MGDVIDIISRKRKEREEQEAAEANLKAILPQSQTLAPPVAQPERLLKYFAVGQGMPGPLKGMCEIYANLAEGLAENLKASPERTLALRRLLESRDEAIRALVDQLKGE